MIKPKIKTTCTTEKCKGKAIYYSATKKKFKADNNHNLCLKCLRSQKDSLRVTNKKQVENTYPIISDLLFPDLTILTRKTILSYRGAR